MQIPLEVTWKQVDKSEALEQDIRKHADKLEELYSNIISCRVVVEKPHVRHHQGNLYQIRVILAVPDKEIVVDRNPEDKHAHEDAYVTVRDAFNAVKRQLEDYSRKRRGDVKNHVNDEMHRAKVLRKFPDQGYGFLITPDAREIFFHENSVTGSRFDALEEGAEVSFIEEMGEQGPQARKVLTGKHDIAL